MTLRNPPFAKGDQVSCMLWNNTLPPKSRERVNDPCTVIDVREGRCQSGFFVEVEGKCGRRQTLDSDWLVWASKKEKNL
jgi:hypothetical protein